jgi:hypothetical protein
MSAGRSARPKPILSATLSQGSSRGSWKMMPILACGEVMTALSSETEPVVARSRPAMARSKVDLPQPEPPMMAMISPGAISAETRSSAWTPFG